MNKKAPTNNTQDTKHKAYPKYKPSGVEWLGDVPAHWEVKALKFVCRFAYGNSLAAEEREDGDYLVYGSNGPVGTHILPNTKSPVIIVGRKGSYGKINFSDKPAFAIDTTYFIDDCCTKNSINWLKYALIPLKLDEGSKDSAVPGLAREDAYENKFILPPLPEQQAIAAFLDRETGRIDSLITQKQRLLELLAEQRSALISRAVTKGLNPDVKMKPSGIEWLGDVPEHWETKRLKHIAALKSGNGITVEEFEDDGDYPVFGGNGFRGFTNQYTHDGSYVLIGRQGALCGNINYAEGKFWASEHAVVATPSQPVATFWLGELLRIMNLNQYSVSAAQPGLAIDRIKELFLPFPPIQEQQAIAAFLDNETAKIDALSDKATNVIKMLNEYRMALISSAVTGKIDVRQ